MDVVSLNFQCEPRLYGTYEIRFQVWRNNTQVLMFWSKQMYIYKKKTLGSLLTDINVKENCILIAIHNATTTNTHVFTTFFLSLTCLRKSAFRFLKKSVVTDWQGGEMRYCGCILTCDNFNMKVLTTFQENFVVLETQELSVATFKTEFCQNMFKSSMQKHCNMMKISD